MEKGRKPLKICDTVLRDAHQSLLATRMETEDMLPILSKLDKIGYFCMEVWGGATFDSCIRFLCEDPWERIRKIKGGLPNTPTMMLLRGQNIVGYRHYADDVVEAFVERAAANGVDIFRVFDALNDIRNMTTAMRAVKKAGKHLQAALSYTVSPVHSIPAFVEMAKELEKFGADTICVKDMAGLISPVKAYELISELKKVIKVPIHLHSHYTSGMASMAYFKAAEAGVDIVDTAISTMALGTSQPPTETIVAVMRETPYDTGLDIKQISEIARYFSGVRAKYKQFESQFTGVDTSVLISQIPGGMMSNFEKQLRDQNALDRLPELIVEIPRVRKELGYPPLVTPTSQIVGTQATLNVLMGERYKMINKETREYIKGMYGKPPGEVDPDLMKKVLGDEKPITCRPADLIEPEMEKLKAEVGDKAKNIDDLLIYALFSKVGLEYFEKRGKPKVAEKKPEPAKEAAPAPAPAAATVTGPLKLKVVVDGKPYQVEVEEVGAGATAAAPRIVAETPKPAPQPVAAPAPAPAAEVGGVSVNAPLPGDILKIKCAVGDKVKRGDVLVIMEAMKMETEIKSTKDGEVSAIKVSAGDSVAQGQPLVVLS